MHSRSIMQIVFFDEIVWRKEEIQGKVLEFFEKVKDSIELESYIIDFVMFHDGEIKIVELNPFSRSTGSCLFDWIKDKELIENGPFQFRIVENPNQPRATTYLLPWKFLVETAKNELEGEIAGKQQKKEEEKIPENEEEGTICVVS